MVSFNRPPRPLPGKFAGLAPDRQFLSDRGGFLMYLPRPGMFYSQAVGYVEREPVERVCELASEILAQSPTIDAFHDWSGVVGYDSGSRVTFTWWMVQHYRRVGRVRVLTRSKLVAMGVSATELAVHKLGFNLDLHVYGMRDEFETDFLHFLQ